MADATIRQETKRGSGATRRQRGERERRAANLRYIPADVEQAVRERDRHQCTFVGETGNRCSARRFLEFDHIEPVARGGQATLDNLRLRCRAHNQYEAECVFGTEFMKHKRERARQAAAERKAIAATPDAGEQTHAGAAAPVKGNEDVIPWLRQLGFTVAETRRAASHGEAIPDAPLEERVGLALSCLAPRGSRRVGIASG
jgi:5-methylcytosine-specific restriction endonuclease McrA